MMTVHRILRSKGAGALTIDPDSMVLTALEVMADHDVGALVVVEGGEVIGMFSERDYARKVVLLGRSSKDLPVRDIMSPDFYPVSQEDTVEECMELMTRWRVRHLPVMEDGNLIGLVSMGDVVKALVSDQRFTIEQLEHYITAG